MRIADLNWMQLERYLEMDDRIVLNLPDSPDYHDFGFRSDLDSPD